MSARSYLSIGDVLSLLRQEFPDVTISKIRFLESQGLVNPERTPSGYRKFYEHDIDRLKWVLRQQREHFLPLKVIKDRLDGAVTSAPLTGAGAPTSRGASRTSATVEGVAPSGKAHTPPPGAASIGSPSAGPATTHPDATAAEERELTTEGRDGAATFAADEPVLAGQRGGGSRLQDDNERGAGVVGDRRPFDERSGSTAADHPTSTVDGNDQAPPEHTHPGPTAASTTGSPAGPVSALGSAAATGVARSRGPAGSAEPAHVPQPAGSAGPAAGAASSAAERQGTPSPGVPAPAQPTGHSGSGPTGGGRRRSKRGSGDGRSEQGGSRDEPSDGPPAVGHTAGTGQGGAASRRRQPGAGETAETAEKGGTGSGVDLNGATLSIDELATESGLEIEMIRELESYGLLHASSVAGVECYDEEALVVALAAAGFARFGVEPRHLRLYKNAADREAGFVEQVVLPLVRQRNPEARARAEKSADELARLGQQLRSSLLRTALGDLLDS